MREMLERAFGRLAVFSPAIIAGMAILCAQAAFAADEGLEQQGDDEGLGLSPIQIEKVESVPASAESDLESFRLDLGAISAPNVGAPATFMQAVQSYGPAFSAGAGLVHGIAFKNMPSDVRDPLSQKWGTVESVHAELLRDAPAVDGKISGAVSERDALNAESARLAARKNDLARDIANFNSTCVGTLPPNQYYACKSRQAALLTAISVHNQNVRAFEGKVAAWKQKRDVILGEANSLSARIKKWGDGLEALVGEIREKIEKTQYGTCTQQQYDSLKRNIDEKCANGADRRCNEGQTCDDLKSNVAKQSACYEAQKQLAERCFGGQPQNAQHRDAIAESKRQLDHCLTLAAKKKETLEHELPSGCKNEEKECKDDQTCEELRRNYLKNHACAEGGRQIIECEIEKPSLVTPADVEKWKKIFDLCAIILRGRVSNADQACDNLDARFCDTKTDCKNVSALESNRAKLQQCVDFGTKSLSCSDGKPEPTRQNQIQRAAKMAAQCSDIISHCQIGEPSNKGEQ